MKKLLRKTATVLGSSALVGMTIGTALAASYPEPFTSNTAIVVGANAAPSDNIAASSIASNLDAASDDSTTTTLSGASGVTEDEVVLGGAIDASATYKIESEMTDSEIPSLFDGKVTWDDGVSSEDYDVHEEIAILANGVKVLTTLDDEDLEGVALSNEMGLEYKYVFDEAFPISRVGMENDTGTADDLYLTIMGEQYEVQGMTATSITVVTSEEVSLSIGESVTVDGKTFTLDDVFSGKAQVNGEIISESSSKKINGIQVEVDTVGYHSNAPELSKVILKIGSDITKTFSDGDEYIGEDEDDPLWVWDFGGTLGAADSYIGVKYNVNINDGDDEEAGDSIKYVGEGYIFPEDFAEVRLDGLTDVDYEMVTIDFMEKDLYNVSDAATANEDLDVIVINAENTDSITVGGEQADEIYIYYANNASAINAAVGTNGAVQVFYRDHDGDFTPTNKARWVSTDDFDSEGELTRINIATIEVGDTIMDLDVSATGGYMTVHFENPDNSDIDLAIGGTQLADAAGTLEQLGSTLEDADANDITVNGTDVSTKEKPIMDYYGIIVAEDDAGGVEGNADEDEVALSIPSDKVYGIVSAVAGGQATTSGGDAGVMTVSDDDASSVAGKNLVVVGGSAINSVAASLLGGSFREAAFTSATGVGAGEFLIQSFDRDGETALLVAGYNAADTEKAVTYLLNNDVDTSVGMKMKGTSATQATVVTA